VSQQASQGQQCVSMALEKSHEKWGTVQVVDLSSEDPGEVKEPMLWPSAGRRRFSPQTGAKQDQHKQTWQQQQQEHQGQQEPKRTPDALGAGAMGLLNPVTTRAPEPWYCDRVEEPSHLLGSPQQLHQQQQQVRVPHSRQQQQEQVRNSSQQQESRYLLGLPQQLHTPVSAMKRASLTGLVAAGAGDRDGLDYSGENLGAKGEDEVACGDAEGMDLCSPSPAPLALRLAAAAAAGAGRGSRGGGSAGGITGRRILSPECPGEAGAATAGGKAEIHRIAGMCRAAGAGCSMYSPIKPGLHQEQQQQQGQEQTQHRRGQQQQREQQQLGCERVTVARELQCERAGLKRFRKPQAGAAHETACMKNVGASVCLISSSSSSSSGEAAGEGSSEADEEVEVPAVRLRFNGTTPLAMARPSGMQTAGDLVHVGASDVIAAKLVCSWDGALVGSDLEDEGFSPGNGGGCARAQGLAMGGRVASGAVWGEGGQVQEQVCNAGTLARECIELD
jgi:hypothetical protein